MSVGDAKIADVILLNPSEMYMLGRSTGTTNLILWNAPTTPPSSTCRRHRHGSLQARINELLPNERISTSPWRATP
jgi:pilus assembly protein CpaC